MPVGAGPDRGDRAKRSYEGKPDAIINKRTGAAPSPPAVG